MPATATDRLAGLTTSVAIKPACVTVVTSQLTLSGLFTLGGVALQEGDRVLVTGQNDPIENGIYNASTSDWQRALDFDGPRDVVSGTLVIVRNNVAEGALYEVTTLGEIIIGETAIHFRLHDDPTITYAQTQAEIVALVTPVNYSFPPLYVDRYAINEVPGTTDMSSAFTHAVKVAQQGGGTVRWGASGIYLVTAPINCATSTSNNQNGVILKPDVTNNDGNPAATILAKHSGNAVFDCTGNTCIEFENVSIQTDDTVYPKVGILLARAITDTGNNSQINRLTRCRIFGKFSVACFYNYGSEDDVLQGCYFENRATDAGTKVAVWTCSNIFGLTSSFVSIRTGQQSCIDHTVIGCQFFNNSTHAAADCIYNDGSNSLKCYGGWMDCRGRSYFCIDGTTAAPSFCVIHGLTTENSSPLPTYGITFQDVAGAPTGWSIEGCYFATATYFLIAPSLVILDNFYIRGVAENAARGISAATMRYSQINCTNMSLLIGTSQQNTLVGDSSDWTITTSQSDNWVDLRSGIRTWTPNTSGITFSGGTPSASGAITFDGRKVTVTIVLSGQTTLTATAGQQITGIPITPAQVSADVSIWDVTASVSLGSGYVSSSALVLPAFTAGTHQVVITATYTRA